MTIRAVLPAILLPLFAGDVPARAEIVPVARTATETPMIAAPRSDRSTAWAASLAPVAVTSGSTGATEAIRLYSGDGEVDEVARMRFEHVVARDGEQHELAERLEQLVVKTAYHFGGARVMVVSGWREHAGRHSTGDALDFKLEGVPAAQLAAYLRGLPRVGVGIYTHPRTQYVHLDVREPSYHWLDGSPPGVTWKERQLRDPGQMKRDGGWTPQDDLPL
jgi:peptidase M15-like protein